ncbi:hypothetical protein TSUD_351440 [Trifolium subterraneum]|uniref:Uncharacterized protein n=1 Tax=Trifolium subterraneum TaxID=3900 RepID=A0A2Z6NBV6_TRISU|nr:hypothetical protein TSUD_351440 [Trifolium subterraneum]
MKEQEIFEKLIAIIAKINQDKNLTVGGEESPIDSGGRNIASEKENKASQNLTSAEAHITVDRKNMNDRLWEEFLKWVKKHDESEGMLKPPHIGKKVERRRLESMNATDVCVSDEPIARRERFNRTSGDRTVWGIQSATNSSEIDFCRHTAENPRTMVAVGRLPTYNSTTTTKASGHWFQGSCSSSASNDEGLYTRDG